MKGSKARGLFSYLFAFLSICLGVICILLVILMFSPGTEIFGFSYVNANTNFSPVYAFKDDVVGVYQDTDSSINKIVITTGYFNVEFVNTDDVSGFKIQCNGTIKGFAKDCKNSKIGFTTKVENKTFYITSIEPDVKFAFSRNATLTIFRPLNSNKTSYSTTNKAISVITDSGSVSITDTSDSYKFYSFDVQTNTGSVNLGEKFSTVDGDVTIKTNSSKINVEANIGGTLRVDAKDKIRMTVGSTNGNVDIKANFTEVTIDSIAGRLGYASYGGYVKAGTVGRINCSAEVDSVAKLTVDTCRGDAVITNAKDSDITIKKVLGDVQMTTTSGNVQIDEICGWANIKTDSGKIVVLFNTTDSRMNILTTNYGYIKASFLYQCDCNINQYKKGGVDVIIKDTFAYNFNYFTKKGIEIYAETTNDNLKTNEFVQLSYNNATDTSKTIQVNNDSQNAVSGDYNGYIKLISEIDA